ncbi:hypothetical protein CPB86DRAFT_480523 [Serendipita vermifera]|nr:hypothetical protein CPB86DRAFT_480523 [Serendipita vermifera]
MSDHTDLRNQSSASNEKTQQKTLHRPKRQGSPDANDSKIELVRFFRQVSPIYGIVWYPWATSSDPATFCVSPPSVMPLSNSWMVVMVVQVSLTHYRYTLKIMIAEPANPLPVDVHWCSRHQAWCFLQAGRP